MTYTFNSCHLYQYRKGVGTYDDVGCDSWEVLVVVDLDGYFNSWAIVVENQPLINMKMFALSSAWKMDENIFSL